MLRSPPLLRALIFDSHSKPGLSCLQIWRTLCLLLGLVRDDSSLPWAAERPSDYSEGEASRGLVIQCQGIGQALCEWPGLRAFGPLAHCKGRPGYRIELVLTAFSALAIPTVPASR